MTEEQASRNDAEYRPTVKVKTAWLGGAVAISVWDNSTGIPEAIQERMLEPFFTTKPPEEGTGLGLSIAVDMVAKHGGHLDVASEEGKYTEITVTLPVHEK